LAVHGELREEVREARGGAGLRADDGIAAGQGDGGPKKKEGRRCSV
jgi:hypothetical protein